ncbi:hypothetical protein K1719_033962 [Acacia pycnantha]|nr:hypothetical protein K1719_033962 [Acacia pycnantha]
MVALIVAVNPRAKFSDEKINAIIDEVFCTYGEFIDGGKGLTYEGLLRTYDDDVGDVDQDFDAFGLELNLDDGQGVPIASKASSSSIEEERVAVETQKNRGLLCGRNFEKRRVIEGGKLLASISKILKKDVIN